MVESAVIAGGMLPKLEACGTGAQKRCWPGAHYARGPGGNAAAVLFHQARMRHGGDRRMNLASVIQAPNRNCCCRPMTARRCCLTRGKGVYLWDSTGQEVSRFPQRHRRERVGPWASCIQAMLKRQAGKLIHVSNLFFHEYQAELAKRLTKISGLDKAFFCNSGTEAWEGALKLARAFARARTTTATKPSGACWLWKILFMAALSDHWRRQGRRNIAIRLRRWCRASVL